MKPEILFLAHRVPNPPDRGDKIRSHHLLRHLAERASVHLLTFADHVADLEAAEALRPLVSTLHVEERVLSRGSATLLGLLSGKPASVTAFHSLTVHRKVRELLATCPIEAVFAFSGQMAQFVPEGSPRFIMDFVDVDSAKFGSFAEAAPPVMRWLLKREDRRLAAFERAVAQRASHSLFVSDAEAALFRRRSGLTEAKVGVLENGVDVDFLRPDGDFVPLALDVRGDGPLIVFTGQMDYAPNIDAVIGFVRHVMPVLLGRNARIRFAIVGRNPTLAVQELQDFGGVIVTGAVEDTRPWLAAADIVVAPLGIARGVQNKVLEAMAMARPVVASPEAFEGIDATPDEHLIVAPSDRLASVLTELLADPDRAATIGRAARYRVKERYGWAQALAPLGPLLGLDS